ncbi:phosphoesterase [Candidatus Microgenomates bacterium]|nr:phosphoesterase [Candidatus Microgenomates bacterium]
MKRIYTICVVVFLLLVPRVTHAADFTSIKTVFIIVFENHDWASVKSAPYFTTLLTQGAHAEQYFNPPHLHPSEPNYIWLEAGSNFGITNDSDPTTNHIASTAHLVTQLNNAGISWKAYQEDIPGTNCPLHGVNKFAPKHLGALFFEDVVGSPPSLTNAYCIQHVRPYTELAPDLTSNAVAKYNFITPNLCNDMHDCSVATGDTWLSQELPKILASNAYKDNGAVFITFDEGAGSSDGPIGFIMLSPLAKKGYVNNVHYTHSSTLKTIQEIFGVTPLLGDAANATDLADLFDFAASPNPTTTTIPVSVAPSATPVLTGGACSVLLGDANHDGKISLADYSVWRTAFMAK